MKQITQHPQMFLGKFYKCRSYNACASRSSDVHSNFTNNAFVSIMFFMFFEVMC